MSLKKNKILLVFPQGIGDFFFAIKYLISELKYYKPEEIKEIYLVGQYEQHNDLIKNCLNSEKIKIFFIFSKLHNFKKFFCFLKIFCIKFDFFILDPNTNIIKSIILLSLIRAKNKIYKKNKCIINFFYSKIKYSRFKRKDFFLNILNTFFLLDRKKIIKDIYKKNFQNSLTKIGIAPGSGKIEKHKRWSIDKWIGLINSIYKKKKKIEFYLYGNENNIINKIFYVSKRINSNIKIYKIKDININNIISSIINVDHFISNDNGLACISTLLGLPTYIITGPTYPKHLIQYPNCKIFKSNFQCSPCYNYLRLGCGNPKCLDLVSYEKISKEIIFN